MKLNSVLMNVFCKVITLVSYSFLHDVKTLWSNSSCVPDRRPLLVHINAVYLFCGAIISMWVVLYRAVLCCFAEETKTPIFLHFFFNSRLQTEDKDSGDKFITQKPNAHHNFSVKTWSNCATLTRSTFASLQTLASALGITPHPLYHEYGIRWGCVHCYTLKFWILSVQIVDCIFGSFLVWSWVSRYFTIHANVSFRDELNSPFSSTLGILCIRRCCMCTMCMACMLCVSGSKRKRDREAKLESLPSSSDLPR